MVRKAWPKALNAQFFNSKWGFISVGVCFLSKMKCVFFRGGFFPQPQNLALDFNYLGNTYFLKIFNLSNLMFF